MTSDRQTFHLDEVYDFRSGLSKPRNAFGTGYPFLTFKDVFYNFFVPKVLGDLVDSTQAEQTNSDIKRGDVFLTRTSETQHELGMSCVALSDVPNGTFNGFTKRLRPKPGVKIVPEYAAYYFRSPGFRERVSAISTLSTRASLNEAMLGQLQIVLPHVDIQTSIGTILKALDDKIDLLRQMNWMLEEIARAVFRAWFVEFQPVRAKVAGATSFRGIPRDIFDTLPVSFEDSDIEGIPKGWSIELLKNLVSQPIRRGVSPNYTDVGGVVVLNQKCVRNWEIDFGLARRHDVNSKSLGGKVVELFDILINSTGVGTLGRVAQVYELQEVTTVDSHLSIVKPDPEKIFPLVLGFTLTQREDEIERLGHGSTGQTELSRHKLGELKVVVPAKNVQKAFSESLLPVVVRKVANKTEISTLTSLRDTLLPKLISGELEAPDLETLGLKGASNDE
jgi:type I restriction enzyme, S subunit